MNDVLDKMVSAELPDKEDFPILYATVTKHMIHGPSGESYPRKKMKEKKGMIKFSFQNKTIANGNRTVAQSLLNAVAPLTTSG